MEPPQKTTVSYTDDDGKVRHTSILPEQLQYYDRWRKIKHALESNKLNSGQRQKAYDEMDKCVKLFTYQKSKDEPTTCDCGCVVIRSQLARHRATAKHTKQLEALNQEQEEEEMPRQPIQIADTDKICECGQVVSKANYARHLKGSRHAKYIQTK